MLGILNHPKLDYTWFTTTLLRWSSEGLVVYDRWVLNLSGVGEYGHNGGTVLLDFYYLCYLIAFIGVLFFFTRYRKQGWLKVKPHVPYDALLLTMIGVLVGAKTAYIFIYNPDFYFGPPPFGPVDTNDMLQRIFLNWSGMASHGAAAGVMCMAILWWLRARPKVPIAQLGDVGGIAAAFGAIWIRLANFMNGELYGRVAPDWLPWAMRFPVRSGKGNAVVFQTDTLWERMPKPENPELVASWLKTLQESNPGGVIEQTDSVLFRNPDAYQQGWEIMLRTQDGVQFMAPQKDHIYMGVFNVVTTPRHPSQLYQLLLEGVLVLIFLLILRKRVKRAGMVAAGFWIAYPVARFIGEFFRQPDVQFQQAGNELGTVFLGLSMGQILSLLMACVGTGLMIYFARFGRVIADEPMYPPEPEKPKAEGPVSVTIEKGMGGSTGAGEIAGIETVRAALAEKEKEWAKDERPEGTLERQDDDQDKPEPGQPERGD